MSSPMRWSSAPRTRRRYSAMHWTASSAASGSTMSSSEPARKTVAWSTARSRGLMPRSGGMEGKTAAPSGTSLSASPAMSASCHGGDDRHFIACLDGRAEVVEVANVFIIHIDVDKAADLPVLEEPLRDAWKLASEIVQGSLHSA